jgi:hypothetical protein
MSRNRVEPEEFKITMDMLCSKKNVAATIERSRLSLDFEIQMKLNTQFPEIDVSSEISQDIPKALYERHMDLRSEFRKIDAEIYRNCARFDQKVASGSNAKSSDVGKPSSEWSCGKGSHQDEDDPLLLRNVPIESSTLNLLDDQELKKWLFERPSRVNFINHCGMNNPIEAPNEKYGKLYMKFCLAVDYRKWEAEKLVHVGKKPCTRYFQDHEWRRFA